MKVNFALLNEVKSPRLTTEPKFMPENKFFPTLLHSDFPWLKNHSLAMALNELRQITFQPQEILYIQSLGAKVPFKNGHEAVQFIKDTNIRISFEKLKDADVHAQYDFEKNMIKINDKYKNTVEFGEILAISEAILHEAGHAKDFDGASSVQEEIDFLSMNVLAHRAYLRKYPDIFKYSASPIIQEGVSIYNDLFFDSDPEKNRLIKRLKDKYGDLPVGDAKHPPSDLAKRVK